MLFALLFLFHSILVGWLASTLVSDSKKLFTTLAYAIVFGVLLDGFFILVFSWLFGSLNAWSILLGVIAATALVAAFKQKLRWDYNFDLQDAAVFLPFFLLLAFLSLTAFQYTNGGYVSVPNVYADYPFHASVINSFALNNNFPPQYFIFNSPLTYSFFSDFYSAILVKLGLELSLALALPNVICFLALVVLAFELARLFGGRRVAFAFLAFLFLFSSYASIHVIKDFVGGNLAFKDYTFNPDAGLRMINFVISLLLPQRTFILGAAIVFLLFIELQGVLSRKRLLVCGALFSILPLVHFPSFLAAGLLVLWAFARKPSKDWVFFALPCVLLLPAQALWFLQKQSATSFFGLQVGWLAQGSVFEFVLFWLKNGWVVLALGIAGFVMAEKKARSAFIPFLLLFVVANIVRLQPWDWDNTKYFFYAFVALSFFAALVIDKLLSLKPRVVFSFVAVVLFFLGTLAGLHAIYSFTLKENHFQTFSAKDVAAGQWVVANTPVQAVFLTGRNHNNFVYSLAGRRVLLGFDGWAWSHGFDSRETFNKIFEASKKGDCASFKQLGADYVVYGKDFLDAYPSFDYSKQGFTVVYSDPLILKLEC